MNGNEIFENMWSKYPRRLGKKAAFKYFKSSVKNQADLIRFERALETYLTNIDRKGTEPQFIMYGSTFFNNWEDWVDYKDYCSEEKEMENIRKEMNLC